MCHKKGRPFPAILAHSSQFQQCPANSRPFSATQSIQAIHSHVQPFKPFSSIYSHLQPFPNMYSQLQQFKLCTVMFCHVGNFQPFLASSSHFQPFLANQTIYSHLQKCPVISAIYSHFQSFPSILAKSKSMQLNFVLPHIFIDKIEVQPHNNWPKLKCCHTYLQMKLKVSPHKNLPCSSYFGPKTHLHSQFQPFLITKNSNWIL